MKKEEMKVKVKEFTQKYEKELKFAGGTGLVILGSLVGWKACKGHYGLSNAYGIVKHEGLAEALNSVITTYPNGGNMILSDFDVPLKISDLGALGKEIMDSGISGESGFTHFMMFGERIAK